MPDTTDIQYMQQAIRLAGKGMYTTDPNPRVGCVIVKDGRVIGEGWHQRAGEGHAEVNALAALTESANSATAYVTLEPCSHFGRTPPCCIALKEAGISHVKVAMKDPNPEVAGRGLQYLREAGIEVSLGICEKEAQLLNPGFIQRMSNGRPWVRLKVAMTLDGRTALASGESQWITGEAARRDVQFWRARSSAVLTGIGTVLADDPSLNVRLDSEALGISGEVRQPLRIVVDTKVRTPANAKLLNIPGKTLIYSGQAATFQNAQVEGICLPADVNGGLSLSNLLEDLANKGVNELLVEAGSILCGAFLSQKLVDELICYVAPVAFGNSGRGAFETPTLLEMKDRFEFNLVTMTQIGDDIRLIYKPR